MEYKISLHNPLRVRHLASALAVSAETVYLFANGSELGKAPAHEARLAWGELGRMCHGTTPTKQGVIEALHQLVQVHIMN